MSLPEDAWVTVARLGKTRGNRGEITALALSDRPERYQELGQVYLCGTGAPLPHQVEHTWFHNGTLIFKFQGVDTISDAQLLVGMEVRIPIAERTEIAPGEFFQSDLVGCEVVDRKSGARLGRVEAWQDGGGCGLLVVEGGLLIPFARSICVEIDVQARRIAVELPEGLRELNAS
ncbi:MAG TPA: ribosome maturation factor RimM [Bryobacteraceae bacterium]